MADLHLEAGTTQFTDQRQIAGQLRRQGDQLDRRQCMQGEDFFQAGGSGEIGLSPEFGAVDVGAFKMNPEQARSLRLAFKTGRRQGSQRLLDFCQRRGHGRGQHGGRAMARMQAGDLLNCIAAFHHVKAAAAMHMQIDKTGQQQWQRRFSMAQLALADRDADDVGNAAATMLEVATHEALRRQDKAFNLRFQTQPSRRISATKS